MAIIWPIVRMVSTASVSPSFVGQRLLTHCKGLEIGSLRQVFNKEEVSWWWCLFRIGIWVQACGWLVWVYRRRRYLGLGRPAECPKLAQPITGICLLMETLVAIPSLVAMILWLARGSFKNSSIFNIVILLPWLQMKQWHISKACIYCLHQTKKATRNIYDDNNVLVKSKPSRGTFICTNHHCHASTMSRDYMSSELMLESNPSPPPLGFPSMDLR